MFKDNTQHGVASVQIGPSNSCATQTSEGKAASSNGCHHTPRGAYEHRGLAGVSTRLLFIALATCLSLGLSACEDEELAEQNLLQNQCVINAFSFERSLGAGEPCINAGYGDCAQAAAGSNCQGYCAHFVCQDAPCEVNEDCASGLCETYTQDDRSYGKWCIPAAQCDTFCDSGGMCCTYKQDPNNPTACIQGTCY